MEWLKKLLGESGLSEEQISKIIEAVSKEIPNHFVAKDKYNSKAEEIKDLQKEITERDTQLNDLKKSAGDNEGLKKQIEDLETKNKKTVEDLENKLKEQSFNFTVETAISKAGAKNVKTVKALLDLSKISQDSDNLIGFEDQMKLIKESDGYLFGDDSLKGRNPKPGSGKPTESNKNPWAKDSYNLTEQGKILKDDPELAKQLMAQAK